MQLPGELGSHTQGSLLCETRMGGARQRLEVHSFPGEPPPDETPVAPWRRAAEQVVPEVLGRSAALPPRPGFHVDGTPRHGSRVGSCDQDVSSVF